MICDGEKNKWAKFIAYNIGAKWWNNLERIFIEESEMDFSHFSSVFSTSRSVLLIILAIFLSFNYLYLHCFEFQKEKIPSASDCF